MRLATVVTRANSVLARMFAASVSLVAVVAPAFVAAPAFADDASALWDDVAHPNRHACALLVQEAGRFTQASQPHAATQALHKASALCPADREVAQLLGESLLQEHDYPAARRTLEHARALAEGGAAANHALDVSLAFYLGFAREVTGDLEGAVVEHRRLESMGGLPAPNQYLVHYNLGDELMAVGRLQEAIEEYRRAVLLAPDRSMPRLALAVALDREGELDKSRSELSVALSIDPQLRRVFSDEYVFVPPADAHYYLALGLLARGLTAEARIQLRTFVASGPAGPYIAQAAERLAAAEHTVDGRELEVSDAAVDSRAIARSLGPVIVPLEKCLPPSPHPTTVKLLVTTTGLYADPAHPASECMDLVLKRLEVPRVKKNGWVVVPFAGLHAPPPLK
jgi:tetratricopeptide (TPR) repeat protein